MGKYLHGFGVGKPPKVLMLKEITDKLDYTKIKNFYLSKYTIKIMKMQATERRYFQCMYLTKDYV